MVEPSQKWPRTIDDQDLSKCNVLIEMCEDSIKEHKKYELLLGFSIVLGLICVCFSWYKGHITSGLLVCAAAIFLLGLLIGSFRMSTVVGQILVECLITRESKPYKDLKEN